jgi:hypothetical protein
LVETVDGASTTEALMAGESANARGKSARQHIRINLQTLAAVENFWS